MFWPEFRSTGLSSDLWREMDRLQQEMDRLFSGLSPTYARSFPAVNIWEGEGDAVVTTELPGVDPDKIDLSVRGDMLTIAGVRDAEPLKEGETYHRQERRHGQFVRTVKLPFRVDESGIEASFERGILSIRLPRHRDEMPKKIPIKTT
jgi:HSP20 family protein